MTRLLTPEEIHEIDDEMLDGIDSSALETLLQAQDKKTMDAVLKLFHLGEGHGHKFEFCKKHHIFDCIECFGLDKPDSEGWWWFALVVGGKYSLQECLYLKDSRDGYYSEDYGYVSGRRGKWAKAFAPELEEKKE